MDELTMLLKQVDRSYDDFVFAVRQDVNEYPELLQDVIDYIKEDPSRNSSDILGYLWMREGRSLEPLEVVDELETA